ncbi:MAG: hypothetical protein V4547_07090 [Bacteroidota bacterium]
MATKSTPSNNNVNTNNNTNNVNVNVNVKHPETKSSQKKSNPNWYTRTILGGIIALALSLCLYLIKKNLDAKSGATTTPAQYNAKTFNGIKQN